MIVRINPADIGSYYWLKDNVKLNVERWLSNWSVLVYSWLEINIELYINSHSVEWPINIKLNCTFHKETQDEIWGQKQLLIFFFSGGVKLAILWFLYTCIFFFSLNISCGSIHWNMQRLVFRIKARFLEKKVFLQLWWLAHFYKQWNLRDINHLFSRFLPFFLPQYSSLCRCIYPNNAS